MIGPGPKRANAGDVAVLRIELAEIEPLIWRRVAVRHATKLQTLHRIVQAAMGWRNCHLWAFQIDETSYALPMPDSESWDHVVHRASTTRLGKLIHAGTTGFTYTYDMGDSWEHRIIVERTRSAAPEEVYPLFLGGERRCPPEDCGGFPGYEDFLRIIAGPDKGKGSRKKKEMLDWYGGPYDPDNIDEDLILAGLKRIARAARAGKTGPGKAGAVEP